MLKSPRFAFATLAAVAGLATAMPAQAITTFANFAGIDNDTGVRFQNSNPNNTGGVGGSLFTTAPGASTPGSRQVQFSFLLPGLGGDVTNVGATFTLGATTATAAQTLGSFTLQSNLTGSFSFLSNSAITANGINYAAGSNLLSGTFNDVSISGQSNSSSASYNGSTTSGATILYTSDFVTFANGSNYDLSISLTSLAPLLFAQSGRSLRSFEAYSTGSFSSDPSPTANAVPEPSVWGLMIVGFGLVGVAARRRNTAGALTA